MITGIRACLALRTNLFCINGTSCIGISTPKSPRATINPSQYGIRESIFSTASGFSILAITGTLYFEFCAIKSLSILRSSGVLTNDKANQSTSKLNAKMASFLSFSVRAGKEIFVFGRFTPFFEDKTPPTITLVTTFNFLSVEITSNNNLPSSIKICSPGFTSLGKF